MSRNSKLRVSFRHYSMKIAAELFCNLKVYLEHASKRKCRDDEYVLTRAVSEGIDYGGSGRFYEGKKGWERSVQCISLSIHLGKCRKIVQAEETCANLG